MTSKIINMANTPSFFFGYWRPWKKNSDVVNSWLDFNKDNQKSQYLANLITTGVKSIDKEQISLLKEINKNIGDNLQNISNDLQNIQQLLYKGFVKVAENQEKQIQIALASNLILNNIQELLKIPDSEKERFTNIKGGLNFIANVNKDETYFDDAKDCFSNAVNIRKHDYISLFYLGYIYLYSSQSFDLNAAINYFELALKYAIIDNYNEINTINKYYIPDFNKGSNKDFISSIYILLSQCHYLNDEDEKAINYTILAKKKAKESALIPLLKYASRANKKNLIDETIDEIFDSRLQNFEYCFNEIDILSNSYTLKGILERTNKINTDFEIFKEKYSSVDNTFKIHIEIKSKILNQNNTIMQKLEILKEYPELKIIQRENEESKILSKKKEEVKAKKQQALVLLDFKKTLINKLVQTEELDKKVALYDKNRNYRRVINFAISLLIFYCLQFMIVEISFTTLIYKLIIICVYNFLFKLISSNYKKNINTKLIGIKEELKELYRSEIFEEYENNDSTIEEEIESIENRINKCLKNKWSSA